MNRQQRRATAKRERAGAADARPRAGDSGLKRSLELYQAGQVAEAARKLRMLLQKRPDQPNAKAGSRPRPRSIEGASQNRSMADRPRRSRISTSVARSLPSSALRTRPASRERAVEIISSTSVVLPDPASPVTSTQRSERVLARPQIGVGQEASGACVRLGHNLVVRPPVGERPQCGRDCRNDERCLSAIRDRAEDETAADEHHEPE